MDSLEREAMAETALPDSGDVTPSDPVKTVEPAQQAQQKVEPASDAVDLHTPQSDPKLEAQRQRLVTVEREMIASNTRKTMARNEEFKREQDALTAERQQLAAMTQQQLAQQQGAQLQQPGPGGIASRLPTSMQAEVTPQLQEIFNAIEGQHSDQMKAIAEQNEALGGQVKTLQTQVETQRQQTLVHQYKPQLEALNAKYGDAITPDVGQAVLQEALNTGLDLDTAMLKVAPNVVRNQLLAGARATATKELEDRYGDLGHLAGMDQETLGQAPIEAFKSDESMETTFIREHGQRKFNEMTRE